MKIYEAVDATSDEQYIPLGLWLSLEEALKNFEGDKPAQDYDGDGSCVVEIREREIGWSEHGKLLATISWIERYDEALDEMVWDRSVELVPRS